MASKILAVDRALEILEYLYKQEDEVGISEISRELDIPKSTVHRTLITLEGKDFIHKNIKTDKYWLGMKICAMGEVIKEKISIIDIIEPHAEKLYEDVKEVINVSVLNLSFEGVYESTVIFKKSDTVNVLSVNPRVGSTIAAHTSSVGKSLLAFNKSVDLETARKTMELEKYTDNTINNWDDLLVELEEIRKKGYALDNEEREIGLSCIGAPIFDKNQNAIAAISISGPTNRMKQSNVEENIKKLVETARNISLNISNINL